MEIKIFGKLAGEEKPVFLDTVHTMAEYKAVVNEYKDVYGEEISFTREINKEVNR